MSIGMDVKEVIQVAMCSVQVAALVLPGHPPDEVHSPRPGFPVSNLPNVSARCHDTFL
jgi:hypothetical protein